MKKVECKGFLSLLDMGKAERKEGEGSFQIWPSDFLCGKWKHSCCQRHNPCCPVATGYCKAEKQQWHLSSRSESQRWEDIIRMVPRSGSNGEQKTRSLGRWARYCPASPDHLLHEIQSPEGYNYCESVVLDMLMLHSVVATKDTEFSLGDLCKWEQNVESSSPAGNTKVTRKNRT